MDGALLVLEDGEESSEKTGRNLVSRMVLEVREKDMVD